MKPLLLAHPGRKQILFSTDDAEVLAGRTLVERVLEAPLATAKAAVLRKLMRRDVECMVMSVLKAESGCCKVVLDNVVMIGDKMQSGLG